MRIFTLGKKGVPLFFFAFFLMTGTYTYGQNCPVVVDEDGGASGNQQTVCYLSTVADLQATANGDSVAWYRTATSTNPIPANEILENATYYAGNVSATCNSRPAVEVTVINLGAPTPSFGSFFQPCEYSTSDISTVADLLATVDADDASYVLEAFLEEFSGSALDPNAQLVAGTSYFVGQRDPNADPSCPSTRIAIQYSPVLAVAPDGDTTQQFCEGATVADLQAQATSSNTTSFRWYSTATSNPALASSTPLVNGETYYASQIVNRTGSTQPPCESQDRFAVTVDLFDVDNPEPIEEQVCSSAIDNPTVDGLEDFLEAQASFYGYLTNGTFNPTIEEVLEDFQAANGIGVFTTSYTVTTDCGVAVVPISIEVIESQSAEAGTIENRTVSETSGVIFL
ncbi:immunoglobulin domain-containing protein, partial [Salinimicrobium sp. HB62]|uniref:immunoglobulin domain-containing protein n=1 Tax=Salinimicrobium sp. HB62 TaxID=3077781 RepID=UPI002D79DA90